jgi:hypothetical protein
MRIMGMRSRSSAKVTIRIARDVLKDVAAAARHARVTRSEFITRAIIQAVRDHRGQEITRQINRALANPNVRRAARREMKLWENVYEDWLKDWTW